MNYVEEFPSSWGQAENELDFEPTPGGVFLKVYVRPHNSIKQTRQEKLTRACCFIQKLVPTVFQKCSALLLPLYK